MNLLSLTHLFLENLHPCHFVRYSASLPCSFLLAITRSTIPPTFPVSVILLGDPNRELDLCNANEMECEHADKVLMGIEPSKAECLFRMNLSQVHDQEQILALSNVVDERCGNFLLNENEDTFPSTELPTILEFVICASSISCIPFLNVFVSQSVLM